MVGSTGLSLSHSPCRLTAPTNARPAQAQTDLHRSLLLCCCCCVAAVAAHPPSSSHLLSRRNTNRAALTLISPLLLLLLLLLLLFYSSSSLPELAPSVPSPRPDIVPSSISHSSPPPVFFLFLFFRSAPSRIPLRSSLLLLSSSLPFCSLPHSLCCCNFSLHHPLLFFLFSSLLFIVLAAHQPAPQILYHLWTIFSLTDSIPPCYNCCCFCSYLHTTHIAAADCLLIRSPKAQWLRTLLKTLYEGIL